MPLLTDRLDGVQSSLAIKAPCKYATTGSITLSGLGIQAGGPWLSSLSETDGSGYTRIFVWQQDDPVENGIYNPKASGWQRAKDFDGNRDAVQGTLVPVYPATAGTLFYELQTANPVVIGTSEIEFSPADAGVETLLTRLADPTSASNGAGLVTFNPTIAYAIGSTGYALKYGSGSVAEPTSMAFGKDAGQAYLAGGTANTGVGCETQTAVTTGDGITSLGYRSAQVAVSSQWLTSIGANTLSNYTGLGFCTSVGYGSSFRQVSGYSFTVGGFEAGHDNVAGNSYTIWGYAAGRNGTANAAPRDASFFAAFGLQALRDNYADYSSAFGTFAGERNTTGLITATGASALQFNTTGTGNTGNGYQVGLNNTTGSSNTESGHQAGLSGTTGSFRAYYGALAGYYNDSEGQSSYFGYAAGQGSGAQTGGGGNSAFGSQAMELKGNVSNCTAGGLLALRNVTGNGNTAWGANAGQAETNGTNNTWIGNQSGTSQATGFTNTTNLGYQATSTASNQITLGNSSVTTLRCQVTTITALSDARDKKDIGSLAELLPESFIDEVMPAVFRWAMRDGTDRGSDLQAGVIAQQLKAVQDKYGLQWLKLVDESNPERMEATPGNLLMPLIVKVQAQEKRLRAVEAHLGL